MSSEEIRLLRRIDLPVADGQMERGIEIINATSNTEVFRNLTK
jgi:hypothetical protein